MRLFSGRPDPSWHLAPADAARFIAVWQDLVPRGGAAPVPPPLGYRGCFAAEAGGRRWEAYATTATCAGEVRSDPDRRLERLIIETAPPGVLPPNVAELAGL